MNENFSGNSESRDAVLSSEEDPFTFTDLLFEIAETLDFVLIPQPRANTGIRENNNGVE